MTLTVDPHPLLDLAIFTARYDHPRGLGGFEAAHINALLRLDAPTPFERGDTIKAAVRDLLRHGGYKPTGRGKPASEYLIKAVTQELLQPINVSVDACNVASLHSGLPISVVDLDRVQPPLRVGLADEGATYVFNASGQEIKLSGLLCLHDGEGPCANGVKDSQRTKTHEASRHTLSLVWGTNELPGYAQSVARWYRDLLEGAGVTTHDGLAY